MMTIHGYVSLNISRQRLGSKVVLLFSDMKEHPVKMLILLYFLAQTSKFTKTKPFQESLSLDPIQFSGSKIRGLEIWRVHQTSAHIQRHLGHLKQKAGLASWAHQPITIEIGTGWRAWDAGLALHLKCPKCLNISSTYMPWRGITQHFWLFTMIW